MLDLSGPDVRPSTRAKAGKWAQQPYVVAGYLSLFDAACMMAGEGYGGIFDDCSQATRDEIFGFLEALNISVEEGGGTLEGYPPVQRYVADSLAGGAGRHQDVYPLIAFRNWVERTGCGDGRYFAKAAAPGGSAPTGGVPSEGEAPKKSPFQYVGPWAIEKNTPRYALLKRKKSLTVYEFACLYCGIDPNEQLPDDVYKSYVEPLIDFLGEHIELEDDVPF